MTVSVLCGLEFSKLNIQKFKHFKNELSNQIFNLERSNLHANWNGCVIWVDF